LKRLLVLIVALTLVGSAQAQFNSGTHFGDAFGFSGPSGASCVATGCVIAASIEASGYVADVTFKGLATGGTYTLNPNSATPTLAFNVTSQSYTSAGAVTTVNRTVYGTIPLRNPYPNGTTNNETTSGSDVVTRVVLSDDILPTDALNVTAASAVYTKGSASLAISNFPVTNSSTMTEYQPIGNWLTQFNIARQSGASMTVEFAVTSKFSRGNGQVAAVVFTASDGSNTVTQTASTMTQSAFLFSTTCTADGSTAVLTSCGSTTGLIAGQYVTITGASGATGLGGEPKISSFTSNTITLSANTSHAETVTVTLGNPVYIYSVTFTNTQLNTLNSGTSTVKAVAYTNVGTAVLDTSVGTSIGGAVAASTITPNVKNLQFYNDKTGTRAPVWAWVGSSAGGLPAVQTTSADPGSTAYYGSIKAAADGIKTYMNANRSHNDACGGYIYLKGVTITGSGGSVSSDVPTNCTAMLTIDCDPTQIAGTCIINGDAAANRDFGYTSLIKNIKFIDNVTNKIVIAGPDGASTTARAAHVIFQNCWLLETQASASAFVSQIGWRQYYNSLGDESAGSGSNFINTFSTTGTASEQFGSTFIAKTAGITAQLWTSLGNVYSAFSMGNSYSSTDSVNQMIEWSALSAFDKFMIVPDAKAVVFTMGTLSTTTTGQSTAASNVLTSVVSTTGIYVGQQIQVTGFSSTPTVQSFVSNTSITLDLNATYTQAVNIAIMQPLQNYSLAQDVFECTGTAATSPCDSSSADGDFAIMLNFLRQYVTVVGNRTNSIYDDIGGSANLKTSNELYDLDYSHYRKSDYFANASDRYVVSTTPTAGSGYTTISASFAAPTSQTGLAALGTANLVGGGLGSITLTTTACGNTGGIGYSAAPIVTITGDGSSASATATISAVNTGQPCALRVKNWRARFDVGAIGNVTGPNTLDGSNAPSYVAWIGDFFGLPGNTTTVGYNQSTFTFTAANQNSSAGGNNTGFGNYKPSNTTGLTSRVPTGFAGFPGDIHGDARKNDGTGCAGAYEC
jgi:hypothetical protein